MADYNPVRTRLKLISTADAKAGEAKAAALKQQQETTLAGNEANKLAARNQAYATSAANAEKQFEWYNTYLLTQQQQGYVGGD